MGLVVSAKKFYKNEDYRWNEKDLEDELELN